MLRSHVSVLPPPQDVHVYICVHVCVCVCAYASVYELGAAQEEQTRARLKQALANILRGRRASPSLSLLHALCLLQ